MEGTKQRRWYNEHGLGRGWLRYWHAGQRIFSAVPGEAAAAAA